MTMPSIQANVEKKILLTQFKRSFSILSNVFVRAQADYGDIKSWGLRDLVGKSFNNDEMYLFFETYIVPYVNQVKFKKKTTLKDLGYKESILYKDGNPCVALDAEVFALMLNDGSIYFPIAYNFQLKEDSPKLLATIYIFIDVNGSKKPNIVGRDIFYTQVDLWGGRLLMGRPISLAYSTKDDVLVGVDYVAPHTLPRDYLVLDCKTRGLYCSQLILEDGWEMKKDYPW